MEQRSGARGVIVAIDGHKLKKHHPASEFSIDAGCHVIEAQFTYKIVKSDNLSACNQITGITGVQVVGIGAACQDVTKYRSGRQHFAIPIHPGKRYEFSTLITNDAVNTYFAEVDPELGTVARHLPVKPGTRTCAPGVPIGDAASAAP